MKKTSMSQTIRLTLRCIRDVNRYIPGRMAAIALSSLMTALSPYATIWLSAQLLNELANARRPEMLWKWAALTLVVTAVLGLVNAGLKHWKSYTESMHNPMKNRIFTEKFFSMDYADVDDQKVRDQYAQIMQNENLGAWGMNSAIDAVEELVQALAGIAGAVALTVSLFTSRVPETAGRWTVLNNPGFALILLALMAGTVLFGLSRRTAYIDKFVELTDTATMGNRLYGAMFRMMGDNKRRLDIRTYRQEKLMEGWMTKESVFLPGGVLDRLQKGRYGILFAVGESGTALFTGAVYAFVCLKALGGAFGVGSVTQYVGAATALSSSLSKLLSCCLVKLRSNGKFLEKTYAFLDTPNTMYQGSLTTEKRADRQYDVEFCHVSFRYPGREDWALKDVSMKFRVGSLLAIVGENGSGKTTFIKLLCRLYDPQEGQILLNGIDIRKYDYRDYMQIFSVVFQDFQLLSQPLGENVAGCADYDRQRAEKALLDAGFGDRLATLSEGLDTMLYKDFAQDGVEISGGEAQKIAIARALYKDAPFIILDEPTAALDPIAEAEIYEKFNAISGDRTAIYISHRLSSCRFCDEIAVFSGGRVVQQGTHQALLAEEAGKYARLWHAQAQYYTAPDKKEQTSGD